MFDSSRFFTILVEGAAFSAAAAAVVASVLMYQVTKKFGSGILAYGFKAIAAGILFIAFGMIIDALLSYFVITTDNIYSVLIYVIKAGCYVTGTYIIVIGAKRTADRLEKLTK